MAVTTGRVCWRPRGFLSPSLHRQHKNICVPGASPKTVNCRCEKLLKFRLSISFSLLAQAILQTHLPETPWRAAAWRPAANRSRRHRRARWSCRRRRANLFWLWLGRSSYGCLSGAADPSEHLFCGSFFLDTLRREQDVIRARHPRCQRSAAAWTILAVRRRRPDLLQRLHGIGRTDAKIVRI
jgi:hypothetical protein